MRIAALLLATALVAGCDPVTDNTLPDGVTGADVALFKVAVADAGCRIENAEQASIVSGQTGFDRDKLRIITQYLTLAGESEPTAAGFRLTTGQCANA